MRRLLLTLLVVSSSFTNTLSQTVDCSQFQVSRQLDPLLSLDYVAVNTADDIGQGTFKGRLTYAGLAWVGLGRSLDGLMVPGEAVIGSTDAGDGVLKYSLTSRSSLGVTPAEQQTLTDTSFVQNATHTVVEFTQVLQEDGDLPINIAGATNFFWAYGSSNVVGFHARFGFSPFEVEVCIPPVSSAPTTPAPSVAPVSPAPISAAPITPKPTTIAPTTAVPTTDAPTSSSPVTLVPISAAPTTLAPVLSTPITASPVRPGPVSDAPITSAPFTSAPTLLPTTAAPKTQAPATATPVTASPTTDAPITAAPITTAPTTTAPTTTAPTSDAPITDAPITDAPVTTSPSSDPSSPPSRDGIEIPPINCSEFQQKQQLTSNLLLEYLVNTDEENGIFSGRLTLEREAWLSFGITNTSAGSMFPSNVVIAKPGEIESLSNPGKHFISARSGAAIVPLDDDRQTLINATIEQGGGRTIMTFHKILAESNEIPIDGEGENVFIYAYGSNNNFGRHSFNDRGSIRLALSACVPGASPTSSVPVISPPSTVPIPITPVPLPLPTLPIDTLPPGSISSSDAPSENVVVDCGVFQQNQQLSPTLRLEYVINTDGDNDIFSGRLTLEREGWLSFGVTSSAAGSMFPSNVVIAKPDQVVSLNNPGKYAISARSGAAIVLLGDDRQTLINSTIEQLDGRTILTFHKILTEPNEIAIDGAGENIFIYAYGSTNTFGQHSFNDRGAVRLALTACVPGSSPVSRGPDDIVPIEERKSYRSLWTAHGVFASLAWGLVTPIAIASSLLRSFFPSNGLWFTLHMILNLTTFFLTLIAYALAVAAVEKSTPNGEPANHFKALPAHRSIGLVIMFTVAIQVVAGMCRPSHGTEENKTVVRSTWEVIHKGTGFGILILAWWQIQDGLRLFATRFGSTDLRPTFWGVAGSIATITAILWAYGHFIRDKKYEATPQTENGAAPSFDGSNGSDY